MRDKYDFLHEDKQVFHSIISTSHNQSCSKYKYPKLQDEVDFLHAHTDKHQTLLQVDTINLAKHGQACPNYAK